MRVIKLLMIALSPIIVNARGLYISSDTTVGSDTISYDSVTKSKPWLTPLKGWTEAKAGDTVYFLKGRYTFTKQIWTKYYGNNGYKNAPIVFTIYRENPDDSVFFINNIVGNSGNTAPIIIEKSFNIVQDINFIGGATWFFVGYDQKVDHFEAKNCNAVLSTGGDNSGFVYANHSAKYVSVINCKIIGPGLKANGIHWNSACIIAFNSFGLHISGCTLSNAPIGIFHKLGNGLPDLSEIVIENNFVFNTDRYACELNTSNAIFRNNIMGSKNADMRINESNGGPRGNNNLIYNNIFYSNALFLSEDSSGAKYNIVRMNLFLNSLLIYPYSSKEHFTVLDSNVYVSDLDSNVYNSDTVVFSNRINYNFVDWKYFSKQDTKASVLVKLNTLNFDFTKSPDDIEFYKKIDIKSILKSNQLIPRLLPPTNVKAVVKQY